MINVPYAKDGEKLDIYMEEGKPLFSSQEVTLS